MKKIFIALVVLMAVTLGVGFLKKSPETVAQVYYVDSSMQRLIPTDFSSNEDNPKKLAKLVIAELLRGKDENTKIMRVIPKVKDGLTVKVENKTAVVNISSELLENHSPLRTHELLTVYQIVNSLTSIDGINNVRFTIDNESKKDFKGFIDMRETFIPDYYI